MEDTNKEKQTGLAVIPVLAQLNNVQFAKELADNIKDGKVEPIMVHIFLKRIEAIQKVLKADEGVQEAIISEASKHIEEGKTFDYMGAKLSLGATYTAYDYTNCNDPLWTALNAITDEVKEAKSAREKFLQAAFPEKVTLGFTAPSVIIDKIPYLELGDCGEEYKLNKPVKRQTTGLKVTLPKS